MYVLDILKCLNQTMLFINKIWTVVSVAIKNPFNKNQLYCINPYKNSTWNEKNVHQVGQQCIIHNQTIQCWLDVADLNITLMAVHFVVLTDNFI